MTHQGTLKELSLIFYEACYDHYKWYQKLLLPDWWVNCLTSLVTGSKYIHVEVKAKCYSGTEWYYRCLRGEGCKKIENSRRFEGYPKKESFTFSELTDREMKAMVEFLEKKNGYNYNYIGFYLYLIWPTSVKGSYFCSELIADALRHAIREELSSRLKTSNYTKESFTKWVEDRKPFLKPSFVAAAISPGKLYTMVKPLVLSSGDMKLKSKMGMSELSVTLPGKGAVQLDRVKPLVPPVPPRQSPLTTLTLPGWGPVKLAVLGHEKKYIPLHSVECV